MPVLRVGGAQALSREIRGMWLLMGGDSPDMSDGLEPEELAFVKGWLHGLSDKLFVSPDAPDAEYQCGPENTALITENSHSSLFYHCSEDGQA